MTTQGPPPGRPGPVPPRPMPPRPMSPHHAPPGAPTPPQGSAPPPRPPVRSAFPSNGPRGVPSSRTRRTSRLAVVALVLAVLVPPVGLVVGTVARRRITRSARSVDGGVELTGRPAATAAVVAGVLLTLAEAALAVALFVAVPPSWLGSSDLPAASVQSTMERTVPLPAGSVHCPGPLPATLGASITCTATQNGAPVGYRATVDSLAGRDVHFAIRRE